MKRHGFLYEKIYHIDNLRLAHENAKKGKTHYRDVKMVEKDVDRYLYEIQEMLINKTYKTSEYTIEKINDRGKSREIYKLPYFPDRIVQWAIMLQIEKTIVSTLVSQTYAALPGKGTHAALNKLHEYMEDREATKYCLKFDVKKFFPSIDREILKQLLRKKFKDPHLLWLLDEIIDSTDEGIPIGNYTSQYFGNFYLAYFDHWLKEDKQIRYMLRYMDDVVILHHDKKFLHKLKREIDDYLSTELNLNVKENWQVFPTYVRGVDFVGYRSFGDYTLLRKSIASRLKRNMRDENYDSIPSYNGWLTHCDGHNLYKAYVEPLIMKGESLSECYSNSTIKY